MNLIFHQAALGDFVLTWPILRGLDGPVTVVAPGEKAALAGEVLSIASMDIEMFEFARLHAEGGPSALSPAVGELFERARIIISFVSDGGDAWSRNVARLSPQARCVYLPTRPAPGGARHVGDFHRLRLHDAGIEVADRAVGLVARPGGPIVVHPGSGGEDKCWPVECFEALLEGLRGRGLSVLPVLGEAEVERWPAERLERWVGVHDAALPRSVGELHGLLTGARAYVGNDAGPTHLAAQLGLPTLALFGPTDPRVWSPRGPGASVLAPQEPRGMDWLGVQAVLDQATGMIGHEGR